MDFGLSEEQLLLEETLRRFLEERLPIARVREVADSDDGVDAEAWDGLAELGVAGCLVPEEHGGAGLALLDAAVIASVLGNGAATVPFLGTAVLAPLILREIAPPEQQAEWLPRIANGSARMGVALAERVERRQQTGLELSNGQLSGTALFVIDGAGADAYLIACGDDVHLVARGTNGLSVKPLPTIDRTRRLVELELQDVRPQASFEAAGGALDRVLDAGRAIESADILGGCDRAVALSVAYAMERKQFERPIATFQAVKHLCAEMVAAIEPARSLVWYAAHSWDEIPDEAPLTISLCKAHLGDVGRDVVRTATEVHGGIGFTDECDLQLWFKRVGLSRQLLGGPEFLRARAAALQGLG
jgi:alkylation response protein AidB-like acyl-CoA dehydrogenase